MFRPGRNWLIFAAVMSFSGTALHVAVVLIGAPAYRFFGSLALISQLGSYEPAVMTLSLAFVFAVFGIYGLSGAGVIRKLPMAAFVLLAIGFIYTSRGLALFTQISQLILEPDSTQILPVLYSAIALLTGCAYFIGTAERWRWLQFNGEPNDNNKKSHLKA